jgi:hypothetical protein
MRVSTFFSTVLLATATGCSLGPTEPLEPEPASPYTELPAATSTVSGIVYDPEAFFYEMALWPQGPGGSPPPALFDGVPYLVFSSMEAKMELVSADASAVAGSGGSLPMGSWQVSGLPTSNTAQYHMRASPPPAGVVLGGAAPYPSPAPLPGGMTYYPTTTLRSIAPHNTLCQMQVATLVGSGGALGAVANTLSFMGQPTTAADLLNPTRTGGVLLFWVYAPSFAFDLFVIPSGGIKVEPASIPTGAQLFAIDWAPPFVNIPGQSTLGYMANPQPNAVSMLGYYALVLPPGETQSQVGLTLTDTVTSSPNDPPNPFPPRPWGVPSIKKVVRPGEVSFSRLHAYSTLPPPPPDPNAEPVPFPPSNSDCHPLPPPPAQ